MIVQTAKSSYMPFLYESTLLNTRINLEKNKHPVQVERGLELGWIGSTTRNQTSLARLSSSEVLI